MKVCIAELIRRLVTADAARNLLQYLRAYIQPEWITFKPDSLFAPLAQKARGAMGRLDDVVFNEDLVDMFIDDNGGENLQAALMSQARERGLSRQEAKELVAGKPTGDLKDKMKEWATEFGKITRGFVANFLRNRALEWIRDHKTEQPGLELEGMDPKELEKVEKKLEEQTKNENEWQEGLLEDVFTMIENEAPQKKQALYKLILKDRFTAKSERSLEDIAKETGVSLSTVQRSDKRLAEMLRQFFRKKGLGVHYDISKKEIVTPKEKDDIKDLQEYIDDYFEKSSRKPSELTIKALELLAEGKSVEQVANVLKSTANTIQKKKNLYFDKIYDQWYKDRVEEIRKACVRLSKVVRKRIEKPEEEQTEPEASKIHEAMVDQIIKKHLVDVTVAFTSDYSSMAPVEQHEKDPNFSWKTYTAEAFAERKGPSKKDGTRVSRTVDYAYTSKLGPKGEIQNGTSVLKLDGKQVSENHPLKKQLDNYVEREVLSKGVIPEQGKFSVTYVNTKSDKEFPGVHKFIQNYTVTRYDEKNKPISVPLFIPDKKYESLMSEKERYEQRKRQGPSITPKERTEVKTEINRLQREIKKESDPAEKKKIQKVIDGLQEWLKGQSDQDLDDVMDLVDKLDELRKPAEAIEGPGEVERKAMDYDSIGKRAAEPMDYDSPMMRYAAMLPPPQSEGAKKFLDLLEGYGITSRPNPKLWLEPADFAVLGKVFRKFVENKIEKEMKAKKPKGISREEWEEGQKSAEREYREEIAKARDLVDNFIKDMKTRKEMLQKSNPSDYEAMSKRKDMDWVDKEEEVGKVVSRFKQEMMKKPDLEKEFKQPTVKMIEKGKYKALEGFLKENIAGFSTLADRLDAMKIERAGSEEAVGRLRKVYETIRKSADETAVKIQELSKKEDMTPEEEKELSEAYEQIQTINKELRGLSSEIKGMEEFPVINSARMLLGYLTYFSKLYSILSSIMWFGEKFAAAEEEEEVPKADARELGSIKDKVVQKARSLAGVSLKAKDQVKQRMSELRTLLKKFIEGVQDLKYAKSANSLEAAEDEEYMKKLEQFVFPESFKHEVESLIKKLQETRKDEVPEIKKEYEELKKSILSAYKGIGSDPDLIEEMAEKHKISENKAAIRLKRHQEALAKAAMDSFILKWQGITEEGRKLERGPFGKRPAEEYENMEEVVETLIPELFTLWPPEEEKEAPKAGIPTAKELREEIEETWTSMITKDPTPEGLRGIYKNKVDKWFGMGGGGKGRTRKKPIKPPVPQAAWEQMKDQVAKMIRSGTAPERIVRTMLALYAKRVKDKIKATEDSYIDPADVIKGFVHLLKNFQNTVVNLKVHPSVEQFRVPPKGAPEFTGTPDIPIDSFKEAEKIFDTIHGIYDEINHFIKPDKVGVPPKSLQNVSKPRKYLPPGLVDWIQYFQEREGRAPQAPKESSEKYEDVSEEQAYRLAARFAGMDFTQIENKTELELALS